MEQDNKNLVQHGLSMISSGIVQAGVGFISNLILVRYISPGEFGLFALVLANATLLSAFFNFRVGDLILRSTDQELERDLNQYANFTFFQSVATAVSGMVVLLIGGLLNLQSILVLIALTISPFIQLQIYLYERNLKYGNIAKIESGSHLISHLVAVGGVLLGWGALVLYLRVLIQPLLVYLGLLFKKGVQKLTYSWVKFAEIKSIVFDGKWIWLDNVLEQSIERFLIIFANFFISISAVGFFFQAKRLAVTPHQLLQPFTTRVLLNYFTKIDKKESKRLLLKILFLELVLLAGVVVFLWFFASPFIVFLFGENWLPVADVLLGLSGVIGFLTGFNTFKAYYIARKELKTFIVRGRIIFIIGLLGSFVFLYFSTWITEDLIRLAIAVSFAYLIAFVILYGSFNFQKQSQD